MANIPNNPWIDKKHELLQGVENAPKKFLQTILSNQHKYIARRQREGTLIEGLDYESVAKQVWDGTVVKHLIGAQPMKDNIGKVYSLQYKIHEGDENGGLALADGRIMSLEVVADAIEAKTEKSNSLIPLNLTKQLQAPDAAKDSATDFELALAAELVQELDTRYIKKIVDVSTKHPDVDISIKSDMPVFVGDRFAELSFNISRICSDIARRTRRGHGNWVLCSPLIICVLQISALSTFAPTPIGSFKGPNNIMLVGKLNGMVDMYSYLPSYTLDTTDDTVIIGYKGNSGEVDAGLFYCPHTMVTHARKHKDDKGELVLPFASKEASFVVERASEYYASFDVVNLTFA